MMLHKQINPQQQGDGKEVYNSLSSKAFSFVSSFLSQQHNWFTKKVPTSVLSLSYFKTGESNYTIICLQCFLENWHGLGLGEVSEEKVDTIQVCIDHSVFVFPLDGVGERDNSSIEHIHVHATPGDKQLHRKKKRIVNLLQNQYSNSQHDTWGFICSFHWSTQDGNTSRGIH